MSPRPTLAAPVHTPPPPEHTARPWTEWLGVSGLYLFALFSWLGTAGAYIATGLMVIALLGQRRQVLAALRGEPLLALLGWFFIALTLSTVFAIQRHPEELSLHLDRGSDLLKLWQFWLIAWWLSGNQRRVLITFGLALTGFFLGRILSLDAQAFSAIANWHRYGFGLPVIAFGQYAAAALLGLLLLTPRLLHTLRPSPPLWRSLGIVLLLLLILLSLQGVIMSQSRGVWLALPVVLAVLTFCGARTSAPNVNSRVPRFAPRVKTLFGLIVIAIVLINSPIIIQRFAFGSSDFFDHLWTGRFEHIGDIAVQARLHMLAVGTQWWLEQPWLGWGPGSITYLLGSADNQGLNQYVYHDLHNIIIDLLARLGLLGVLPLLLGSVVIVRALRRAHRAGRLERDVYLLILALLILHFLCALTNFRVFNTDWRFYWMLFAGAAYTWELASRRQHTGSSLLVAQPAASAQRD